MLWFIFVAGTVVYFAFFAGSRKEYFQLIAALGAGMTLFLVVSFVYPNGHALRKPLMSDDIFARAVRMLYQIDTPTNILPSIHVFNSIVCCAAIFRNEKCRRRKAVVVPVFLLTVAIVLSTVFLKQHSMMDVMLALALNIVCDYVCYRLLPARYELLGRLLTREEVVNLPNVLCLLRIILAVFILGISKRYGMNRSRELLAGILALAAIAASFQGMLRARLQRDNEMGGLLDTAADKATQGALLLCLLPKYRLAYMVFILFVLKEIYAAALGGRNLYQIRKNDNERGYEKAGTAVLYPAMAASLLWVSDMTSTVVNAMLAVCGICILLVFVVYTQKEKTECAARSRTIL